MRTLTKLVALALAAVLGCGSEPTAPAAAESVVIEARPLSTADSLYLVFEDFLYGDADSVFALEPFDALAAQFNAQRWGQKVVDTLDFDGDGVADRLLASPERSGLFVALYLADGDSLTRARHDTYLHFGQSYAVCYEPGRQARIYTYQAVGVHFDVWASELLLADGHVTLVSDESFPVWPDGNPAPRAVAERARLERRAKQLEARTEGPPPGCAFRCSYFDCCSAGRCADGGRAPWQSQDGADGA